MKIKIKKKRVKEQKPKLNRLQIENMKNLKKTKENLSTLSNKINVLEDELNLLKNEQESLKLKIEFLEKVKEIVN